MKLISMTDFVLEKHEEHKYDSSTKYFNLIINYANFLKQPLTLGMFGEDLYFTNYVDNDLIETMIYNQIRVEDLAGEDSVWELTAKAIKQIEL